MKELFLHAKLSQQWDLCCRQVTWFWKNKANKMYWFIYMKISTTSSIELGQICDHSLSENTCKSDSCQSLQFTDPSYCQMQCTKVAQKAIRDWLGGLINLFQLQITTNSLITFFVGKTACLRFTFKKKDLSFQNDKIHTIFSLLFLRKNN